MGNAVPYTEVSESVRVFIQNKHQARDRSSIILIQTPQCFRIKLLKKAYRLKYKESFTDDASVMEAYGSPIYLVKGRKENIKITTPEDLIIAEALLHKK